MRNALTLMWIMTLTVIAQAGLGAASPPPEGIERIKLWPDGAPDAKGEGELDTPTIDLYLPDADKANGTAVVVYPGGGYGGLAMGHEGMDIGRFYQAHGVAAFVTRYRLGSTGYRHPVEMHDAQRAIRWVRAHAEQYKIDPKRIGVMGFSAGGHLAGSVTTHYDAGDPNAADPIDRVSCRPDFSVLCYGVLSMDEKITHMGSRKNLLGDNPPQELVDEMSAEKQVTKDTPPVFIFHTSDDGAVPVMNSVRFYIACHEAGVPAEMHIFRTGRHGVGLAANDPKLNLWPELLVRWMQGLNLISGD
ncbi:MAG: prolyl oligopeptidase family serine peptidase [Planctomycetes bacterium]|nr:prolyl oligopeptidase family serine peptidase [Planctomycetota bacterium]